MILLSVTLLSRSPISLPVLPNISETAERLVGCGFSFCLLRGCLLGRILCLSNFLFVRPSRSPTLAPFPQRTHGMARAETRTTQARGRRPRSSRWASSPSRTRAASSTARPSAARTRSPKTSSTSATTRYLNHVPIYFFY